MNFIKKLIFGTSNKVNPIKYVYNDLNKYIGKEWNIQCKKEIEKEFEYHNVLVCDETEFDVNLYYYNTIRVIIEYGKIKLIHLN